MFSCLISDIKKPAKVRIQWRGVAGVIRKSMIKPFGIVNHDLTFKRVLHRVYQNIAPLMIVLLDRRLWNGAFLICGHRPSLRGWINGQIVSGERMRP